RAAAMGIERDLSPDITSRFCSTRLRHALKLADIGSYSDDPDVIYDGVLEFTMSGIELIGHEFGHQWMAGVNFDLGDGAGPHCLTRGLTPPAESPMNPYCDGYLNSDFNLHWS